MHEYIRRLLAEDPALGEQAWITGRGAEQRLAIGVPGTGEWVASRVAVNLEEAR